jgi:hypothetical protein
MPTTLERAAFSGLKQSTINLKLVDATLYPVGTATTVGNVLCTVTQVLPNNQVKAQVTGGPASSRLLLPEGTIVS